MIVWTMRPYNVYLEIMDKGEFFCNLDLSINLKDDNDFLRAYHWMIQQMIKKIGVPSKGETYPIWTWYRSHDYKHQRPDFRWVRDYISEQIEMAEDKKSRLRQKSNGNEPKIQTELDNLTKQLDEVSALVTDKLTKSKGLFNQMSKLNDNLVAADVTLSRYESVKGQYVSDIKRLSFIVDGEVAFENIEEPLLCPVCGQPVINVESETKHVEAAQKELSRTLALLNDLEQATSSLAEEKLSLQKRYAELEKESDAIQKNLMRSYIHVWIK